MLFADDIAILARNEKDMQRMLEQVNQWCQKWRLSINQDKSKVIHFRFKGKMQSAFQFNCGELNLDYTSKYKYLGMWMDEHQDFNEHIKAVSKSASRALGALIAKFHNLCTKRN